MYGSRRREVVRSAMRTREHCVTNTREHIRRAHERMITKRGMVQQMEDQCEELTKRMKICKGPSSIPEYMKLKEERQNLQKTMESYAKGEEEYAFLERAFPLIVCEEKDLERKEPVDSNIIQEREALAMSLFHRDKAVPVFIQTDRCTKCGCELRIKSEESLVTCPKCGRTTEFLQLSTDHVDGDYVAQDTDVNHVRSTLTGGIDNTSGVDNPYPKPALYHKFLLQFSSAVAAPPPQLIDMVLQELSKVHIHHSSKVQATPISNILKKHQKSYAWMSLRISMMLKQADGEPFPIFSEELIDRLIRRFRILIEELIKQRCRNRKRVFNFQFLTKVFLIMEGKPAMAELFENHKTRDVLRREDKRIGEACKIMDREKRGNLEWKFYRSM